MGKVCDVCGGEHHAKGKCKFHYRMPSQINPKPIVKNNKRTEKATKSKNKDSLSALLSLAELVCNKYIRKRDSQYDKTFKCISCGWYKSVVEMDAGHFISKLSSSVRFHEDNIHGECQQCNRNNPDHLILYEKNLMWKIGIEKIKWLKAESKKPFKWDREELYKIIEYYKAKLTE